MPRPLISLSYGFIGTTRLADPQGTHRGRAACLGSASICTMIAMPLMCPDLSNEPPQRHSSAAIAQDSHRSGLPPDQPLTASTLQPLDPGILNSSIPAFFIGRNKDGFWLARDVKGKVGGMFLFESSALAFARRNSWPSGCATISPSERFELDVENRGNPFIEYLRPLIRFAMHDCRRMTALVGKTAKAIERRLIFFKRPFRGSSR